MSFAVTPVVGFPPGAPEEFPMGLQWQLAGADVGGREVDTVNFVAGDTLAMVVDPEDPKLLTITIPTGGEGGAVPNLVLTLTGNASFSFNGSGLTEWTASTVVASADAEWNGLAVEYQSTGLFRISIVGRVTAGSSVWPSDAGNGSTVTKYGSAVDEGQAVGIQGLDRSVHERSAFASGPSAELTPGYVQWTDEYVVEVLAVGDSTTIEIYADHYLSSEAAFADAIVTVTKLD